MGKFRRAKTVASLLAAGAFCLASQSVANAASGDVDRSGKSASYTDFCATGRVASLYDGLKIRTRAENDAPVMETVGLGAVHACKVGTWKLGDRYNGCGVNNANGWIIVSTSDGRIGFSAMTCWRDV